MAKKSGMMDPGPELGQEIPNQFASSGQADSASSNVPEPDVAELGAALGSGDPAAVIDTLGRAAAQPGGMPELTVDDIKALVVMGFEMVAARRGAHWKVSPAEADRMAYWLERVSGKYGMAWIAKILPELMSGALIGYAILTRVQQDKQLAETAKPAAAAA